MKLHDILENEEIIPVKYRGDEIGTIWEYNGMWHGEHAPSGKEVSANNPSDVAKAVHNMHREWLLNQ